MINMSKAVLDEDGEVETFMLTVEGVDFHCRCGANCFHKPNRENVAIYRCNSCGLTYKAKDKCGK